jgi:hypothetical protein
MTSVWLYRASAVIFVLFAIGHTVGFMSFKPPTAEGMAVLEAMNRVHFQVGGATFSYGGFYNGFGIEISLFNLFSAFLAWHLAGLVRRSPGAIGLLGWTFFALNVGGVVLSAIYFSVIPTVMGSVVAICLGVAAGLVPKR